MAIDLTEGHHWLGTGEIYGETSDESRTVIPRKVFWFDLLELSEPRQAYWGATQPQGDEPKRLLVSRKTNWFGRKLPVEVSDRFKYYTHTTVQESNRSVTIPKQFVPQTFTGRNQAAYDSRETEIAFEYGETVHFVFNASWYPWRLCYVLKQEDAEGLRDELRTNDDDGPPMTDGGEDESEVEQFGETTVGPDEVLHLESGEVVPAEKVLEALQSQEHEEKSASGPTATDQSSRDQLRGMAFDADLSDDEIEEILEDLEDEDKSER